MAGTITIEGKKITDIPTFYEEMNRVFMAGEDWKLGHSLDALDDMLYGSYGILAGSDQTGIDIIWKDYVSSREALGYATTKAYYKSKLYPGSPFNQAHFGKKLEDLEEGHGQTYFDIIMEIFRGHPSITLIRG